MTECRSCKAKMIWAVSLAGRRIPIDGTPITELPERELGVFVLLRRSSSPEPLAMPLAAMSALSLESAKAQDVPLFLSHFATCPNADSHRGKPA